MEGLKSAGSVDQKQQTQTLPISRATIPSLISSPLGVALDQPIMATLHMKSETRQGTLSSSSVEGLPGFGAMQMHQIQISKCQPAEEKRRFG